MRKTGIWLPFTTRAGSTQVCSDSKPNWTLAFDLVEISAEEELKPEGVFNLE